MQNVNNLLAGNVIAKAEDKLGWTANGSQKIIPMPKSGNILYSNRAIHVRDDKYFVINRKKQEVEVHKVGDGKYEVRL